MARIRRADTKPERVVRRLLHKLGYRFRLQLKGVPGRPDIAFIRRRKAIFVHGCFWHAHGCPSSRLPKTRTAFWANKFDRNQERDARLLAAAESEGWGCLVLWECQLNDERVLRQTVQEFLGPPRWAAP